MRIVRHPSIWSLFVDSPLSIPRHLIYTLESTDNAQHKSIWHQPTRPSNNSFECGGISGAELTENEAVVYNSSSASHLKHSFFIRGLILLIRPPTSSQTSVYFFVSKRSRYSIYACSYSLFSRHGDNKKLLWHEAGECSRGMTIIATCTHPPIHDFQTLISVLVSNLSFPVPV